jgi:hypothetical protein
MWVKVKTGARQAMAELKIQARIVKEVLRVKGWARKIGNPRQAGTPDLFIKMYGLEAVMLECKMKKLGLTAIQRETLKRLLIADMAVGWMVYQKDGIYHQLFVGADPEAIGVVETDNCTLVTYVGREWDIGEIVKAVLYWSGRYRDGLG